MRPSHLQDSVRAFVLEDDATRMKVFSNLLETCDWDHAESCTQVDRFKPPYDLICLDHDLGGKVLKQTSNDKLRRTAPQEDNGLSFVHLIKSQISKRAVVLIHSYNYDGARSMQAALDGGAIIAPFGGVLFGAFINDIIKARSPR